MNSKASERYLAVLDKLQSRVLTPNYAKIEIQAAHALANDKCIKHFVFNAVRAMLDAHIAELAANHTHTTAIRVDRQLAQELYRHFEFYKLSKYRTDKTNANTARFAALLDAYVASNSSRHPLLVCNATSNNGNTPFLANQHGKIS